MLHTFLFNNVSWGGTALIHNNMRQLAKTLQGIGIVGLLLLFSCQKAPELTITSPTNIELSVDGSSGSFTFTANRDWTISSSDSWVSITPSSGVASDEPITVTVRCGANTTYDDRTATVTITMEELSQSVTVKQPANLAIIVATQSFNLAPDARTIEVEVQANVQYTVAISADWIKQSNTKGLVANKLSFNIKENKTYSAREGLITIKSQNSTVSDQVISVKQAQNDALIVKDSSFDMPYGGGEIEVKVEANVEFDVKPNTSWIHYVETKALSTSTVRLTVDANDTYDAREGKIEVTQKNGTLSHTITVKQAGKVAVSSIDLNKTELVLVKGSSETLTATVNPDNATDKSVTWASTNNNVATVEDGKVQSVDIGSTTITASAGDKTAKCAVTVLSDTKDGVYARALGGSIVSINGIIQQGSKLNFGVYNFSTETITVVSVQLINGATNVAGNIMAINSTIDSGQSSGWTITIGLGGIQSPIARFVYLFKGEEYTCEAKYN